MTQNIPPKMIAALAAFFLIQDVRVGGVCATDTFQTPQTSIVSSSTNHVELSQSIVAPLRDEALMRYLSTNGDWEWIEDRDEQYRFESGGKVSNRYEWDSLWLQPNKVTMYSRSQPLVGAWCQGCGVQVTDGTYSVRGDELVVRGRMLQIIKIDFGGAARGNGMAGDKIAQIVTAFERRGTVIEAGDDRLVISWADGAKTRYRKLRFPA